MRIVNRPLLVGLVLTVVAEPVYKNDVCFVFSDCLFNHQLGSAGDVWRGRSTFHVFVYSFTPSEVVCVPSSVTGEAIVYTGANSAAGGNNATILSNLQAFPGCQRTRSQTNIAEKRSSAWAPSDRGRATSPVFSWGVSACPLSAGSKLAKRLSPTGTNRMSARTGKPRLELPCATSPPTTNIIACASHNFSGRRQFACA